MSLNNEPGSSYTICTVITKPYRSEDDTALLQRELAMAIERHQKIFNESVRREFPDYVDENHTSDPDILTMTNEEITDEMVKLVLWRETLMTRLEAGFVSPSVDDP